MGRQKVIHTSITFDSLALIRSMKTHFALLLSVIYLWLAQAFLLKVCRLHRSKFTRYDSSANEGAISAENAPDWPSASIEPSIKYLFDKNMKNESFPLFRDWSAYSLSLPVRELDGVKQRLYTLKYYTPYKYLRTLAEEIVKKMESRGVVKYLAAPSSSGKTCSVLPAFIESSTFAFKQDRGTHYLYLAFDNNGERHFRVEPDQPSSNKTLAEMQGASFMVKCVESLLDDPFRGRRLISLDDNPPDIEQSIAALNKLIESRLPRDRRIWFHVDEHFKMCDRGVASGANFSRGALRVLTTVEDSQVVATYIERPSIPTLASSTICRYPIALPPPDIYQIAGEIPELNMIKTWCDSVLESNERRLLITLMFRLYVKIRRRLGFHLHRRNKDAAVQKFLVDFQTAANNQTTRENRLKACINLCPVDIPVDTTDDLFATELFLGVEDDDKSKLSQQISDVVVLPNKRLTCSLNRLLTVDDPKIRVFRDGRRLFVIKIRDDIQGADYLSSGPLEAAYYWSISSRAAKFERILFHKSEFLIRCKHLKPGRLFPKDKAGVYNVSKLLPDTIYYVDEREGKPTHPLCDMFFITEPIGNQRELVLIDITGGGAGAVLTKVTKLNSWIAKEQRKNSKLGLTLNAVIIAPFMRRQSYTNTTIVVAGDEAITLLGGLSQILIFESL
jgi:hypothetical protein